MTEIVTFLSMCNTLNSKDVKLVSLNECIILSSLLHCCRTDPIGMSSFQKVCYLHGYKGTQQGINKTLNKFRFNLSLIEIFTDKKDKRHRLIKLTEKGKQLKSKLIDVYNMYNRRS